MLTLEQFSLAKQHQDFFQRLLPLATELADKHEAEKQLSKPIDMVRKLAKRERDYSRVGFETDSGKEFLKLRAEFIKRLGTDPTEDALAALFNGSLESLEEQSEKFIFLEE
ncbi:hypothetical protein [Vibrio parahaemolyticus]|uniref:hypothetical protein n=1 Tax=Vibrio parahaemolyticus TaxID=670 RepID=UPI00111DF5A0|nr:hypothetical protein [Vibrio parahaemolyticus]TOB32320.1 hypothetical protein CGK08_22255 [Vibrio parahaemolyticus]